MAKFSYKTYRQGADVLLAISDSAIVGKTLKTAHASIDVSGFYKGEECGERKALELIRGATIVNAIGQDVVALMLGNKLLDKSMVLEIAGVPHAQIISVG